MADEITHRILDPHLGQRKHIHATARPKVVERFGIAKRAMRGRDVLEVRARDADRKVETGHRRFHELRQRDDIIRAERAVGV